MTSKRATPPRSALRFAAVSDIWRSGSDYKKQETPSQRSSHLLKPSVTCFGHRPMTKKASRDATSEELSPSDTRKAALVEEVSTPLDAEPNNALLSESNLLYFTVHLIHTLVAMPAVFDSTILITNEHTTYTSH